MESLNIREAAEHLGVSHKVIRRLIAQGRVPARKVAGPHGSEWCLEAEALDAARLGPPDPVPSGRPAREATVSSLEMAPREPAEPRHEETRFLQEHIAQLTLLLREAIAHKGGTPGQSSLPDWPDAAGQTIEADSLLARHITEALQSSLRSFEEDGVAAIEMGSVKVLWGKPVLWRVVADQPDDLEALLAGILSTDASWDPPGEEVHFLWALDGTGNVVWGTACGAGWFGAPFQSALRTARVERR